jgi:hypothetical protein
MVSVCVITPFADVISAELEFWVPGHQARNDPLAVLAWTCLPSPSTRVTPVTPSATWPSTTVKGPSFVEARCVIVMFLTVPAPELMSMEDRPMAFAWRPCPEDLTPPDTDSEPPLLVFCETTVTDGPMRHVALPLAL